MKQKQPFPVSKDSGFTIIELLVVLAIFAVLIGLFMVNYAGLRGPRNLRIAQNELATNIRKTQSFALSGHASPSANQARFYSLELTGGTSSYKIQYVDTNSAVIQIEKVNFPTDVTISGISVTPPGGSTTTYSNSGCLSLNFSLPFGRTLAEPVSGATCSISSFATNPAELAKRADAAITLTLKEKNTAATRTVTINGITGGIYAQ